MRKAGKFLMLIVLAIFLTGILAGCVGKTKIGVIDLEQVVAKSAVAKKYQEQLSNKGKELTQKLQKSKATGEAKEKEQQQAYNEFLQTKQGLEEKLDQDIKKAVEAMAKEKNLSAVLYKKDVRYGGVELTEEIIQKLNSEKAN